MGTRVLPEIEYGNDCPDCTPNPVPAGKTPLVITIVFAGLKQCSDDAPIQAFDLKVHQVDGWPCEYDIENFFSCSMNIDISSIDLFETVSGDWWFWSAENKCITHHENDSFCAFGVYAYGGEAEFTWYNIPHLLAWTYGLYTINYPLHEFCGIVDDIGRQVHRLCHRNDHTRIRILFDTNLYAIAGP